MARRRLTPDITRARLTVAADRLKQNGDDDLAEAVEAVLQPRGWELLKPPASTSGDPNVALFMSSTVKKALEEAAAESGQAPATVLAEVVNEGWRKFLAGEFMPSPPVRAPRGKAPAKENLNLRPSGALKEQVEEAAKAASAEAGWQMSAGKIAMAYLFDEYGITAEDQLK
ncbi:hypothetical protein [Streptomyces sp. NPDC018584]|uniref:hypothetical protein n=1 Tax=unclassified Streptomyces TaxID=2593676 RepID=UPI00378E63A1